ncbi:MAG: hypothetical protein ABFD61_01405 [Chloroherpetonaceae bacterium]
MTFQKSLRMILFLALAFVPLSKNHAEINDLSILSTTSDIGKNNPIQMIEPASITEDPVIFYSSQVVSNLSNICEEVSASLAEVYKEKVQSNSSSIFSENLTNSDLFAFNLLNEQDDQEDTSTVQEAPVQRKLLPDNMSWWETWLWGEKGFMRNYQLTSETRKEELAKRRRMLSTHQILGLSTWVAMAAAVVAGQVTMNNYERFKNVHTGLVGLTIIGYATTAYFSLFSPPPLIERKGDRGTVFYHKLLGYVHGAGMIAMPILASLIKTPENGQKFDKSSATAHQIAGYVTLTAFTAAIITITF